MKNYLKVGSPAMIMNTIDVCSFEVIRLISIILGSLAIAMMTIAFNYVFLFSNVADGFQISTIAILG